MNVSTLSKTRKILITGLTFSVILIISSCKQKEEKKEEAAPPPATEQKTLTKPEDSTGEKTGQTVPVKN